jgi:hypothetical protein
MTLIEIIVVLCIVGLAWFTLLPRLNLGQGESGSRIPGNYPEVNSFLAEARRKALAEGVMQRIEGALGSDKLVWGKAEIRLPRAVTAIAINGQAVPDRKFVLRVHPSGAMDNVELTLSGGEELSARSLACRLDAPGEDRNGLGGLSFFGSGFSGRAGPSGK